MTEPSVIRQLSEPLCFMRNVRSQIESVDGEGKHRPVGEVVRKLDCGESSDRATAPGLSKHEIEGGTHGTATVQTNGAVTLRLSAAVTVDDGFGFRGKRSRAVDAIVFRALPAGYRAGSGDRLLSVFAVSIGRPPKAAKQIFRQSAPVDRRRIQVLVGHVLMVLEPNPKRVERFQWFVIPSGCET